MKYLGMLLGMHERTYGNILHIKGSTFLRIEIYFIRFYSTSHTDCTTEGKIKGTGEDWPPTK